MQTTIQQIGNSQGVILPKKILNILSLGLCDEVEIEANEKGIFIKPVISKRRTLDDLFIGADESIKPELVDFGEDVGKEKW